MSTVTDQASISILSDAARGGDSRQSATQAPNSPSQEVEQGPSVPQSPPDEDEENFESSLQLLQLSHEGKILELQKENRDLRLDRARLEKQLNGVLSENNNLRISLGNLQSELRQFKAEVAERFAAVDTVKNEAETRADVAQQVVQVETRRGDELRHALRAAEETIRRQDKDHALERDHLVRQIHALSSQASEQYERAAKLAVVKERIENAVYDSPPKARSYHTAELAGTTAGAVLSSLGGVFDELPAAPPLNSRGNPSKAPHTPMMMAPAHYDKGLGRGQPGPVPNTRIQPSPLAPEYLTTATTHSEASFRQRELLAREVIRQQELLEQAARGTPTPQWNPNPGMPSSSCRLSPSPSPRRRTEGGQELFSSSARNYDGDRMYY